jgi:hypothetical protein
MAIFGGFFLGILAVGAAAAAVWQLVVGDVWAGLILGGVAVYIGHVVGLGLRGLVGGRRRAGTVGVQSEPDGLIFRYAGAPTYWLAATSALTGIVIKTMPSPGTVTRNYLGRSGRGDQRMSPYATVSGSWLAADPALLLRTVAYYLLNPEHRAELGTQASLRWIAN